MSVAVVRSTCAHEPVEPGDGLVEPLQGVVERLHRGGQLGDEAGVLLEHFLSHRACSSACFIRSPTSGMDPTPGGTRELFAMAALNRIANAEVG